MSADRMSVMRMPTGLAATVAYTGTAGDIATQVRGTSVMCWATTDAYICVGATATATNGTPVPAYTPIWLPFPDNLQQGVNVTVSAIQISAGGSLYIRQFT